MRRGRSMFDVNDVMANMRSANVPTRVAFSHAASISSGLMSGLASKMGFT